jgi:hypothetical protein
MGQVFRGTVRGSGAAVAVKVLKPELVSDPEVVARFFRERSILTSIDHPCVVRVVDLVVEGETLGIVMELVEGPDLRRFLRERGTLAPAEAVGVVCQLLDGLAAVHAAGIVHRDVKPENVLVDVSGGGVRVRLTDFGVARLSYGASLTKLSSLIGTPEYMAPEVADHDSAAPAADLYSAGVVLYELLSGRTPFAGGHPMAVLRRQLECAPPLIPGVPPPLWAQLAALLAKDPGSRPASAALAAEALASVGGSLAGAPALPVMAEPGPQVWAPGAVGRAGAAGMVPGGQPGVGTVVRARDRGAGAGAAPAGGGEPRPGRRSRAGQPGRRSRAGWRSRPVVVALPAAVVVLAVAAGLVLMRPQRPPAPAAPVAEASYAFAPQQYHDGLLVVRHWVLGGRGGSLLTEKVTVSSATGKAVRAVFEEAIPPAIAPTVQTVRFTPAPAKIVQADPVVAWDLRAPAQGVVTVGYQARVPAAGVARSRLLRWAHALTVLQDRLNTGAITIQLRSLTVRPRSLNLRAAATAQLKLAGVMRNGKPAPAAIVSAAGWTSADPTVAVVAPSGKVTATGPGTTRITAQVGTAQATAAITVAGGQSNLAAGSGTHTGTGTGSSGSSTGSGTGSSSGSSSGGSGSGGSGTGSGSGGGTGGTPTTPPPPPPPPPTYRYFVYHTCANGACGLRLHSGPGYSSFPTTRILVDGDAVDIVCQTRGESVSGADGSSSNVWDKTAQGDYAADFYINTPGMTGSFSPPIPQC